MVLKAKNTINIIVNIILTTLSLIFISCRNENNNSSIKDENLIISVGSWEDDKVIQFHDLVDSIDCVPLKKTAPYIGSITKLIVLDEKFIIWDRKGMRVWVFDSKGNYLSDIYKLGKAGGEYLDMSDVFVTSDGIVKIADPTRNLILSYGLDGTYISNEYLEDYLPSNYYSAGDYQYIFSAYMQEKISATNHLNILKNGKFEYGYFPYDKIWSYTNNDFTLFKDKVLFYRTFDNNIYEVSDEGISVFAKIQFDPKFEKIYERLRTEKDISSEEFESFIKNTEFAGRVRHIFFTNNHISFSYSVFKYETEYVKSCFYNLEKKKLYDYNAISGADKILCEPNDLVPQAASGDWFFTSKDSYKLSGESLSFLSKQAELEFTNNSNPVIIKYKIK